MALKEVKEAVKGILGTFTGKCCDANVMNNNDMHLSRKLFETLMKSDEYKRAMTNRHYVGFLGHPENPDCQDDQNACIVMTDMRLLDNGEIEGDFDLIDTPVGRIVKAFTDAGVKYGLSIRGLGDVDAAGEVDPEGFIFRGFDLVRFPAYDDCIPEFKAIAASTDAQKKATYKKVCAAIDNNLALIDDADTLKFIQDPLIEGSDEFNKIQDRIDELVTPEATVSEEIISSEDDESCEVLKEQLNAVTELYLDAMNRVRELEKNLVECQAANQNLAVECSTSKSQFSHMKRVVAGQLATAQQSQADATAATKFTNKQLAKVTANLNACQKQVAMLNQKLKDSESNYNRLVTANTQLRSRISNLLEKKREDMKAIEAANHMNLKYKHKIKATSDVISQKDSAIEDMERKLHETVVANKQLESKASNLDDKNGELLSRVEAAEEMVLSYQQAYANIYANALGVYLKDLPVTASTTVDELKQMISAGTSTAGIPAAPSIECEDAIDDEVVCDDDALDINYGADMVTL